MKKLIISFVFCSFFFGSFSQRDTVLFFIKVGLPSEYQIYFPYKEKYILERYTPFKGEYWTGKKDTVSLAGLIRVDSGLVELKKKKPHYYKYYKVCDPFINKIRNRASYSIMHGDIYDLRRSKIGLDSDGSALFVNNQISYKIIDKLCYDEFKVREAEVKQKCIKFIDSVYYFKTDRLSIVKGGNNIDQNYTDEFIRTMNNCETDLRTLEVIMNVWPEEILNSVSKLSGTEYFSFLLRLNYFPSDIKLKDAKASLLKVKDEYPRAVEIAKKMKNKKS